MNKIYKSVFVAEFQSKKYLYYKRLDDLVIKGEEATEKRRSK